MRATAVSAAVVAVLALGACSSSGTVKAGGPDTAAKGSVPAGGLLPGGLTAVTDADLITWLDQIDSQTRDGGCETGTAGLRNLAVQIEVKNPQMAQGAIAAIVQQFRDAAASTSRPAAKPVLSKLAVDAQAWVDAGLSDDSALLSDVQALASACTK